MYRTYTIKFKDGDGQQCRSRYISRLPFASRYGVPEYTYDFTHAVKFTYEEAQKYLETLKSYSYYDELCISPASPANIVYSGYGQAFLAWADVHRHDQLMALVEDFINDKGTPHAQ
jgi:hypothetical protein